MTFDFRFCEVVYDELGHDDTLKHAYRVYLWRWAVGLVHHPHLDEEPTAPAGLCSEDADVAREALAGPKTSGARFDPGSDLSQGADTIGAHQPLARRPEGALRASDRRPLPGAARLAARGCRPPIRDPVRPDPRPGAGTFGPHALGVIGAAFDQAWEEIELYLDGRLRREAARLILANAILANATDDSRNSGELKWIAIRELVRRRYLPAEARRQRLLWSIEDSQRLIAASRAEMKCLRESACSNRERVEETQTLLRTARSKVRREPRA